MQQIKQSTINYIIHNTEGGDKRKIYTVFQKITCDHIFDDKLN